MNPATPRIVMWIFVSHKFMPRFLMFSGSIAVGMVGLAVHCR